LPDTQGPADRPEWLTRATTPTYCYRHPDRQTGLRCSRCDRPICGECATPAPVGQLCPDDARAIQGALKRDRERRRALRQAAVAPLSWDAIAAHTLASVDAVRAGTDLPDPPELKLPAIPGFLAR
jgi:hypothetical protein